MAVRDLNFFNDLPADDRHVARDPLDRDPVTHSSASKVEEVGNHSRHPIGAPRDPRCRPHVFFGKIARLEQKLCSDSDRTQRVTQSDVKNSATI